MKRTLLTFAAAGSLLLGGQAMATDVLQDDDLDRLSAAGDPVVIDSSGATLSQVAYNDDSSYNLEFDQPNAQTGLRALTIQNVVGELQLLVNLNVLSASNSIAGTDQRNFSLQSWGSTLPDPNTVKTVDGVSAVANAACSVAGSCAAQGGTATGGAAGAGGNAAANAAAGSGAAGGNGGTGGAGGAGGTITTCTAGPCTGGAGGSGGAAAGGTGGNAAAAAASSPGGNGGAAGSATANAAGNTGIIKGNGAAATSPGVISNTLGSASADTIIRSSSSGGQSTVAFDNSPTYNLAFTVSNAQTDLSALFISNVVGRAQMALNLNIAAATLNLVPGSNDPFATPVGDTTAVIKQVNTGLQFRGTPIVGSTGTSGSFNTTITHSNQ